MAESGTREGVSQRVDAPTSNDGVFMIDAVSDQGVAREDVAAFRSAPPGLEHLDDEIAFGETGFLEGWRFQTLLEHTDAGGQTWSVEGYIIGPSSAVTGIDATPSHYHDEDQLILVLSGELREGRRVYGPGTGFFMKGGTNYTFTFGAEGAHYLEIRHVRTEERGTHYTEADPSWWAAHGWTRKSDAD